LSGVLSELKPGFLQIVFSRIRRRVHDKLEPFPPNTGEIVKQYLRKSRGKEADKTFGLEDRDG